MPLDAVCLQAVVAELAPQITGSRIEKIQQPARDQVVLLLRGNRRLLLSAGLGALVGLERSKRQKEPMVLSSTFLKKQRFSASPIVFPRLSCLLRDVLRYSMPGGVGRWRASWEKPCAKWRSETKMRVLV